MDRILVASDLSSRSDRAVERAVQLAERHGAKIILMHVIDDDLPAAMVTRTRATAEEILADIRTSERMPENTEVVVETGDPVTAVVDLAEAAQVDLVIMGTHRPRPFWDIFSGTSVERVVRALHRPVLVVVAPVAAPYREMICGIDLSPSCLAAARVARAVAPEANLRTIHAVHIPYRGMLARDATAKQLAPFVHDAQLRLDEWWKSAAVPEGLAKPTVTAASVQDLFEETRRTHEGDLYVLGAHGRSPLSPTLLGSFTEEQIRTPKTDLLIVRG
ncbi:universal stress protein [Celeribacter litoreus]|uniref:universal stress protein n=1 Tax=Celeribacter litoreus TaxID=2876714 RepID=UPI001CCD931F|nr:universal stress protein [Celeribacter litoreus]MCA0043856.1 universal stress protein [Celeribacter litoreus]